MDVRDLVRKHYGAGRLSSTLVHALADAGVDVEHLTAPDLFPVDQLHAGGAAATRHLLERMELAPGLRLLDVGCGIGGPARMAAAYGATVTGIDLTPEFVEAATDLTGRVGLADAATYATTAGEALPFDDGTFDAAVMVHVGMNVPDKLALFTEVHRVLAPGSRFGLYDQMRCGDGALTYPLPWAEDERSSFVENVADYTRRLQEAGFTVEDVEDRTLQSLEPPPPGPVSLVTLFGPVFAERIGHNVAATRAGLLGTFVVVARA